MALQICLADADIVDNTRGHFDVVMAHPEALLCTCVGKQLRCSELLLVMCFCCLLMNVILQIYGM